MNEKQKWLLNIQNIFNLTHKIRDSIKLYVLCLSSEQISYIWWQLKAIGEFVCKHFHVSLIQLFCL